MKKRPSREGSQGEGGPVHRVRLPGFIAGDDVGLGDVVTKTTSYLGMRPCSGCDRRRVALNRWMTFGKGQQA